MGILRRAHGPAARVTLLHPAGPDYPVLMLVLVLVLEQAWPSLHFHGFRVPRRGMTAFPLRLPQSGSFFRARPGFRENPG